MSAGEFVLTESEVHLLGYAERAVRRLLEQAQQETQIAHHLILKDHKLPLDTQGQFVPLGEGKWKFVKTAGEGPAQKNHKGGKVTLVT